MIADAHYSDRKEGKKTKYTKSGLQILPGFDKPLNFTVHLIGTLQGIYTSAFCIFQRFAVNATPIESDWS